MLDYPWTLSGVETVPLSARGTLAEIVSTSSAVGLRWLVVLILAVSLAGCGGDDPEPTSQPSVSPQQVLTDASQRLAETESMHFQLSVDGQTYVDESEEIQLISAEGDLVRPNKVRVQFQVELFGAGNVSIRMITIGPQSWTTDLLSGNWGPAPVEFGYNPTILFDNQGGLGPVMNRLVDPKLIGEEEIGGRSSYHIDATADQASIGPLTGETMHGEPVAVSVWIDKATSDLLQVKLVEPASSGKEQPATWVLTLSNHGEQVEIAPPS
jgi:lipoprotein LprG